VPIVYEKESLGILAVDNVDSKRPLTKSDENLLMGIVSQTAVSITNAISFQRIRESEERYRTILQSMEEGYYELDINGRFTFFNDSLCQILGYSRDELMGTDNQKYTDKKNAKIQFQAFNRVYTTGLPSKRFDWVIIRKDGSKRDVEASISLIKDSKGRKIGFRGIIRDITDRKREEKEKEMLLTRLQQAKKMEAIGTLAGGVAHDLNNILAGLVSYPDLLLMDLSKDSPLRKPILTMQRSGKKAAAIVQNLLTLARRGVIATEVINVNQIVTEYLKSLEYLKLKSFHPEVEVQFDFASDLLNTLGSPVLLSKTVMNLVSNAAEAMPLGGKISISTENRSVDKPVIGYDRIEKGEYIVLEISDTGVGISPDDLEKIFEPFYTRKTMGRSGTGLGMAVVWGTVKDLNGFIDVKSTVGEGTTFTLYFPITKDETSRDKSILSLEDYMGNGEYILVIDDVEEQREIASGMLKKLGYSVSLVSSGEEAVEFMKDHSADLLILDMIMAPGIDGLETYKRIHKLHPGQKAIVASGFSETDRVRETQTLGAGPYLKKPYTLEKIGLAVKTELGN
jgi:PAS domain S-box-containing protein